MDSAEVRAFFDWAARRGIHHRLCLAEFCETGRGLAAAEGVHILVWRRFEFAGCLGTR